MLAWEGSSEGLGAREEEARGISGARCYCVCTCGHDVVPCSETRGNRLASPSSQAISAIQLTDLITGLFAITVVLKLNGPAGDVSPEPFSIGVSAYSGEVARLKEDFVGLRVSLLPASMIPFGKEALSGDRELRSMGIPELIWEACSSSAGGVGVRGGIGRGRFEAIALALRTECLYELMVPMYIHMSTHGGPGWGYQPPRTSPRSFCRSSRGRPKGTRKPKRYLSCIVRMFKGIIYTKMRRQSSLYSSRCV